MDEITLSGKMKNPMILEGVFQSIWEEGLIETPATLNLENGEITAMSSDEGSEYEHLICEKFVDKDENEYTVCPNCHNFILKTSMEADKVGNGLSEVQVCSGDCGD